MPDRYEQMAVWAMNLAEIDDPRAIKLRAEISAAIGEPCPCCNEPAPRELIEQQWCVFYGGEHPDEAAGREIVDEQADAEEAAQWRVESGVAVRTVHYSPWKVHSLCSACGSVLDGRDDCCDGRRAEVEAGMAALGRTT